MTYTIGLLDSIVLFITVLCFSVNFKEISIPWAVLGFGLIALDIVISLRYYFWRYSIPRWFLNLLGVLFIFITFYRVNWDNAVNVLLECLICLVAIKWIERRRPRDYLQILALCLFALVGHAFFTFGMGYLLVVTGVVIGATAALVILTGFSELNSEISIIARSGKDERLPVSWLFGFAIVFLAVSFPLSFVLFFVLPRTETPFLSFLNRGTIAYSGFSDTVELGAIEKIQEDRSVAFRALMSDVSPKMPLYWRGIVYDHFDGRFWKSTSLEYSKFKNLDYDDKTIHDSTISQTIVMESTGGRILFCLDVPLIVRGISDRLLMTVRGDRVFLINRPIDRRLKYDCLSSSAGVYRSELSRAELKQYLSIPEKWSNAPEIQTLLKNLIGSSRNDLEIAKALLSWFKNPPFEYASSGLPISETALEDFILKTRRGNCEYFASALAVMLRMAGIPARLVGGYYGGYRNPVASYYLVLQQNAHVWVEAFFREKVDDSDDSMGVRGMVKGSWVRLDPTPIPRDLLNRPTVSLWFRMRLAFDMIQYFWNRLIIQYDMKEQERAFRKIVREISDMKRTFHFLKDLNISSVILKIKKLKIGEGIVIAVSLIVLLSVLFLVVKKNLGVGKDYVRLLEQFESYFGKRYSFRRPSETLKEWIARINDAMTAREREQALEFVEVYERCLYGPKGFTVEDIKRLKAVVDGLG